VPRRYEELKMKFSTDSLLQMESYVKLVEAIRRAKEMKPLVTAPVGAIYNPAYGSY
jgi:hypothetical protein